MTIFKTLIIACALLISTSISFANDKNSRTGTVAEAMTSGGYVYVRLKEDDIWLASTPIPVTVGDTVIYSGGAMMKDFNSRTLSRTFDSILFVMKLEVQNQFDEDAHAAAASTQTGLIKSKAAIAPEPGEITPMDGGKSIESIHVEAQQLSNQQVALRARVMKISLEILGKNWITLQDGTGTAPNNKLIATSTEVVAVGDLVTVTGMIKTDIDIGSGYKYAVIMEDATFSK